MRGHVRRSGDDRWCYVVDLPRGQDGKRRQKWVRGFRTKKEAERELARVIRDLDTGRDPFPAKIIVRDYLESWLDESSTRLRPRVFASYRRIVDSRIVPVIGDVRLNTLKPAHIQRVLTTATAARLAPRSVNQVRAVLSSAMRSAVELGLIPYNPVAATRPPRAERPTLAIPDAAGLHALVEAARGTIWEPAVLLAVGTGARRSEILALRWCDVDLEAGKVRITRGLHGIRTPGGGSELVFADPKTTRSRREVALPPSTVEGLRMWRKSQQERRLAIGPKWVASDLVCDNGEGGPCNPDSFTHAFKRLARRAGLAPGIRLHDVRHGVATVLLERGVHPAIASAMLGHASESFTMSQYQHVTDRMTGLAATALEEALLRPGPTPDLVAR